MKEIETDRLLLRQFTMADLDELSPIFGDPEVVRYLGSGKPATRAETERALDTIIQHWERHGFGRWAVVCKRTRQLIGYGGLRNFHGTPELVYLLARRFWGIGLATEIARAALKYGFEELHFEHIMAMACVANTASHHVMEKVGMSFEKRAHIYDMDIVCYCIESAAYLAGQRGNRRPSQRYESSFEPGADDFIGLRALHLAPGRDAETAA